MTAADWFNGSFQSSVSAQSEEGHDNKGEGWSEATKLELATLAGKQQHPAVYWFVINRVVCHE